MARGRTFSREFKLAAVAEVVSGVKRPAQVCREHGLAEGLLLRWRREVAERGDAAFGPLTGPARSPWSARSRSWSASVGNSRWRTRR